MPRYDRHSLGVRRGAGAAVAQGLAVIGQAGGQSVALHPLAGFLHQVGEGRQRHELAGGEEVAARRHARRAATRDAARVLGHRRRPASTLACALRADRLMLRRRRKIDPPTFALGDDRHQSRAHPAGFALSLDVVAGDRRP